MSTVKKSRIHQHLYMVLVAHPDNPESFTMAFRGPNEELANSVCTSKRREGRNAILVQVVRGEPKS